MAMAQSLQHTSARLEEQPIGNDFGFYDGMPTHEFSEDVPITKRSNMWDHNRIATRISQICDYLQQAQLMLKRLQLHKQSKGDEASGYNCVQQDYDEHMAESEECIKLKKLIEHLKQQRAEYEYLLRHMSYKGDRDAVKINGTKVQLPETESSVSISVGDRQNGLNSEISVTTADQIESYGFQQRPRIEEHLNGNSTQDDVYNAGESSATSQTSTYDEQGELDDIERPDDGEQQEANRDADEASDVAIEKFVATTLQNNELEGLRQQRDLLKQMLKQQEELRMLQNRQVQLLTLQKSAEQSVSANGSAPKILDSAERNLYDDDRSTATASADEDTPVKELSKGGHNIVDNKGSGLFLWNERPMVQGNLRYQRKQEPGSSGIVPGALKKKANLPTSQKPRGEDNNQFPVAEFLRQTMTVSGGSDKPASSSNVNVDVPDESSRPASSASVVLEDVAAELGEDTTRLLSARQEFIKNKLQNLQEKKAGLDMLLQELYELKGGGTHHDDLQNEETMAPPPTPLNNRSVAGASAGPAVANEIEKSDVSGNEDQSVRYKLFSLRKQLLKLDIVYDRLRDMKALEKFYCASGDEAKEHSSQAFDKFLARAYREGDSDTSQDLGDLSGRELLQERLQQLYDTKHRLHQLQEYMSEIADETKTERCEGDTPHPRTRISYPAVPADKITACTTHDPELEWAQAARKEATYRMMMQEQSKELDRLQIERQRLLQIWQQLQELYNDFSWETNEVVEPPSQATAGKGLPATTAQLCQEMQKQSKARYALQKKKEKLEAILAELSTTERKYKNDTDDDQSTSDRSGNNGLFRSGVSKAWSNVATWGGSDMPDNGSDVPFAVRPQQTELRMDDYQPIYGTTVEPELLDHDNDDRATYTIEGDEEDNMPTYMSHQQMSKEPSGALSAMPSEVIDVLVHLQEQLDHTSALCYTLVRDQQDLAQVLQTHLESLSCTPPPLDVVPPPVSYRDPSPTPDPSQMYPSQYPQPYQLPSQLTGFMPPPIPLNQEGLPPSTFSNAQLTGDDLMSQYKQQLQQQQFLFALHQCYSQLFSQQMDLQQLREQVDLVISRPQNQFQSDFGAGKPTPVAQPAPHISPEHDLHRWQGQEPNFADSTTKANKEECVHALSMPKPSLIGFHAQAPLQDEGPKIPRLNLRQLIKSRREKTRGSGFEKPTSGKPANRKIAEGRPGLSANISGTAFIDEVSSACSTQSTRRSDLNMPGIPSRQSGKFSKPADLKGSDISGTSDRSIFEALRETIYSEVASLISQNERRPHFLIELFKELQLLNSDYLRQRTLYALQDLLKRFLIDEPDRNTVSVAGQLPKASRAKAAQGYSAEPLLTSTKLHGATGDLTPSESIHTSEDDEGFLQKENFVQRTTATERDMSIEALKRHIERLEHVSRMAHYDYVEAVENTSSATQSIDEKKKISEPKQTFDEKASWSEDEHLQCDSFSSDPLADTVINLGKLKAEQSRNTGNVKGPAQDKPISSAMSSAQKVTASNNAAPRGSSEVTGSSSAQDAGSEDSSGEVSYPKVDTQMLDYQIKSIMTEVIPVLKEQMDNVCSSEFLTYVKKLVLQLTQQSTTGKEFARFFHRQLATILHDSLVRFEGRKMRECGEDLLVDISEILFNELAFFRLMQDLDEPGAKAEKMLESWDESQDHIDQDDADRGSEQGEKNGEKPTGDNSFGNQDEDTGLKYILVQNTDDPELLEPAVSISGHVESNPLEDMLENDITGVKDNDENITDDDLQHVAEDSESDSSCSSFTDEEACQGDLQQNESGAFSEEKNTSQLSCLDQASSPCEVGAHVSDTSTECPLKGHVLKADMEQGRETAAGELDTGVHIELAPSETKPYTRIGSDEDDEGEEEEECAYDPSDTAVSRNLQQETEELLAAAATQHADISDEHDQADAEAAADRTNVEADPLPPENIGGGQPEFEMVQDNVGNEGTAVAELPEKDNIASDIYRKDDAPDLPVSMDSLSAE